MNQVTPFRRRDVLRLAGAASIATMPSWARSASANALGLSLPLTGNQSVVGKEMLAGYEIAIAAHASDLELRVLDDGGSAKRTAENIATFGAAADVVASSGLVGTPNAQAAIPAARKSGLPVVGLRSGVASLRDGLPGVYHLRTSYEAEIDAMLASMANVYADLVVVYSNDSFGTAMRDYLAAALPDFNERRGTKMNVNFFFPIERDAETAAAKKKELAAKGMPTNTVNEAADAVVALSNSFSPTALVLNRPTAIIMLTLVAPTIEVVSGIRNKGVLVPVYAMSFTGTSSVATKPNPALTGLGMVNVFPFPWVSVRPMVAQFRVAAKAANKPDAIHSLAAFEGYFYGSVTAKAWRQAGGRDRMMKALDGGVSLADTSIQFDARKVGFNYHEVVYKSAAGPLRT